MQTLYFTGTLPKSEGFSGELSEAASFTGALPEERIIRNAPGGYYIPTVEQVDVDTVKITFAPSKNLMDPVAEQTILLPEGKRGPSPNVMLGVGMDTVGRRTYSFTVQTEDGYESTVSWRDGVDGNTPYIGGNGNWFLGASDTGVPASGAAGELTEKVHALEQKVGEVPEDRTVVQVIADSRSENQALIQELSIRMNTLADSDDVTLDQMAEVVNYIKENRELIETVRTQSGPPRFVSSVEEMTEQDKTYVLTTDGMIYTYGAYTVSTGAAYTNLYKAGEAEDGKRLNSSGGVSALAGSVTTGYIQLPGGTGDVVRVKGITLATVGSIQGKVSTYNADKAFRGNLTYASSAAGFGWSESEGVYVLPMANVPDLNVNYYVRFSGSGASTDDIIITVNEEITEGGGTTVVTGWHSTGMAYVPADYEPRILDLETQTAEIAGDIAVLKESAALETGSYDKYSAVWDGAVAACIEKVRALQQGRHCVTFSFFSDNHQRLGYAGALIAKVMKECSIPYCIYGGDSISSGYIESEEAMIEEDRKFDAMMAVIPNGRFCRTAGNHDGYWAVSANEKHTYSRDQIYELFFREEALSQQKHFGDDGTCYYVDDLASKTRFVILNNNGGFGEVQRSWVQNTALQFSEGGWTVVFVSHAPVTNNFHAIIPDAQAMQSLLTAYISGSDTNKAEIAGWFSGHIHRDRIYQCDATGNTEADDQTTATLPWKTVTVTSDHTAISYDDATKHAIAEDDQSHAIDFVTINKLTKTVTITRLGIGSDRSYSYG